MYSQCTSRSSWLRAAPSASRRCPRVYTRVVGLRCPRRWHPTSRHPNFRGVGATTRRRVCSGFRFFGCLWASSAASCCSRYWSSFSGGSASSHARHTIRGAVDPLLAAICRWVLIVLCCILFVSHLTLHCSYSYHMRLIGRHIRWVQRWDRFYNGDRHETIKRRCANTLVLSDIHLSYTLLSLSCWIYTL